MAPEGRALAGAPQVVACQGPLGAILELVGGFGQAAVAEAVHAADVGSEPLGPRVVQSLGDLHGLGQETLRLFRFTERATDEGGLGQEAGAYLAVGVRQGAEASLNYLRRLVELAAGAVQPAQGVTDPADGLALPQLLECVHGLLPVGHSALPVAGAAAGLAQPAEQLGQLLLFFGRSQLEGLLVVAGCPLPGRRPAGLVAGHRQVAAGLPHGRHALGPTEVVG